MNRATRGPQVLSEHVGSLKSRVGGFVPGSHVAFRGCDLHGELKDMEWLALYVFGITGRRFSATQVRLVNAIWSYTSYPDARLWNNRVAALAGSARSTGNLGMSAALAVSEASIYGRGIDIRAIEFLLGARRCEEAGGSLEDYARTELAARRSIAGYGRPLTSVDERIAPILALARELGLADGDHLRLAYRIEEMLLSGRWRLKLNYAGVVAALCADLGFSRREYYLFSFPAFLAGMAPCYLDAVERPEGTLFPVPCRMVRYEGVAPRTWHPASRDAA